MVMTYVVIIYMIMAYIGFGLGWNDRRLAQDDLHVALHQPWWQRIGR